MDWSTRYKTSYDEYTIAWEELNDRLDSTSNPVCRKVLIDRKLKLDEWLVSIGSPVIKNGLFVNLDPKTPEYFKKLSLIVKGFCCAYPGCYETSEAFKKCFRCEAVYCGKEHEVLDEQRHKEFCVEFVAEEKEKKSRPKKSACNCVIL